MDNFIRLLSDTRDHLNNFNLPISLAGDYNIKLQTLSDNSSNDASYFIDTITAFGFYQQ